MTWTSKLAPAQPYRVSNGLLIRLDGEVDGTDAADNSGNGFDMAMDQGIMISENAPSGGRSFRSWGASLNAASLTINNAALNNIAAKTFAFWLLRRGAGEAGAGYTFSKASYDFFSLVNGSGNIHFYERWTGGGLADWRTNAGLLNNRWSHIVIRHDGIAGSVPEIAIDGVESTITTNTPSSGTKVDDAGVFTLLDAPGGTREFDGNIAEFQWFNRYVSDEERSGLYLRSALRSKRLAHDLEFAITGALTAGFVGPYEIASGT
jgi:hypothetical protein